MIKNVVFDIGNVLLDFKPLKYMEERYPGRPWIPDVYREVFRSREWLELDRGTITEEEAVRAICQRNPALAEPVRMVMADWYDLLTPIEGTIQILKELKDSGYRAYYLSNFHKAAFEATVGRHSFFGLFDGGVASYKVKLVKPDPAIYGKLSSDWGIEPKESLFVDDMADNVKAAGDAGFYPHLFTGPESFRKELERLSMLCAGI